MDNLPRPPYHLHYDYYPRTSKINPSGEIVEAAPKRRCGGVAFGCRLCAFEENAANIALKSGYEEGDGI